MSTELKVKKLVKYFDFKQICGDKESLNRIIIAPELNRPGLDLAGYYTNSEAKRVLIIGEKEDTYMKGLDYATAIDRAEHILSDETPCLILSDNRECPKAILEVAKKRNFPILVSEYKSSRLMVNLMAYLDEKLALTDNVHGVLLNVYGIGVLIIGESGMGKSEITLELIQKGHILVADDRVDVARIHNHIVGTAPEVLRGMLEIRGIGIIDVEKMFGVTSVLNKETINMVISLKRYEQGQVFDRVGIEEQKYYRVLDIDIPLTVLPVSVGRSMSTLVESAVRNYTLKAKGFDSAKEFEKRVIDNILKQSEEEGDE